MIQELMQSQNLDIKSRKLKRSYIFTGKRLQFSTCRIRNRILKKGCCVVFIASSNDIFARFGCIFSQYMLLSNQSEPSKTSFKITKRNRISEIIIIYKSGKQNLFMSIFYKSSSNGLEE